MTVICIFGRAFLLTTFLLTTGPAAAGPFSFCCVNTAIRMNAGPKGDGQAVRSSVIEASRRAHAREFGRHAFVQPVGLDETLDVALGPDHRVRRTAAALVFFARMDPVLSNRRFDADHRHRMAAPLAECRVTPNPFFESLVVVYS